MYVYSIVCYSYGYYGQQQAQEDHYSFSKPKFVIYPYSQHDIPPLPSYQQHHHQPQYQYYTRHNEPQPQVQQQHQQPSNSYLPVVNKPIQLHSVQIQPSLSFELKPNGHGYERIPSSQDASFYHQHQPQMNQVEASVPVIVLRIPGPQKYAAHLQRLLQEYLEIRAAEYIKSLQEEEYHQQHQQVQQEPQQHYQNSYAEEPQPQNYQEHEQQVEQTYGHQHADDTQYESYQPQGRQQEEDAIDTQQSQEAEPHKDSYIQQTPYQHQSSQQYGPPASQEKEHSPSLPVQENYPSPLHTQVIFTGHGNYASQMASVMKAKGYDGYQQQQSHDYPMAAVKYVSVQQSTAAPASHYEQPYAHEQSEPQRQYVYEYHQQHQPAEEEEAHGQQQASEEEAHSSVYEHQSNIVSITQRSVDATEQYTHSPHERPHNYHAHGVRPVNPDHKMKSRY